MSSERPDRARLTALGDGWFEARLLDEAGEPTEVKAVDLFCNVAWAELERTLGRFLTPADEYTRSELESFVETRKRELARV